MSDNAKHCFDEYIVQGEASQKQRAEHWQIAIGLQENAEIQSAISKCKICTLDESAVLEYLAEFPQATQEMIDGRIGRSERTVKTLTRTLQEKGFLARKNGKRNGIRQVLSLNCGNKGEKRK